MFELLQPPRSQSLVDGFSLAGAEVVGAARGRGLWGREGGGGRAPGVDGAVGGVLRLEPCLWGACGGGGRGGYLSGADGGERGGGGGDSGDSRSPVWYCPRSAVDGHRGLVESPGRGLQSPRRPES